MIYPKTLSKTTGLGFSCRKHYTSPKCGSQNGKNFGGVYEDQCRGWCMKINVADCSVQIGARMPGIPISLHFPATMARNRAPAVSAERKAQREALHSQVVALLMAGHSYSTIHKQTGVAYSTIGHINTRWKQRGTVERSSGSGRPRKFTKRCFLPPK